MGRTKPRTSEISHFSHNHPLQLVSYTQSQQPNIRTQCCGEPDFSVAEKCSDSLFACTACNFVIHRACSKLPRLITHPCHSSHNLALLPSSSYTDGSFSCDACGKNSYGFLFNCADCCYDIHTHCAAMPLSITHASHRHPLSLAFACPYEEGEYFCDICSGGGKRNNWLYRCDDCGFDVHIDCVRAKRAPSVPVPQLNPGPRQMAASSREVRPIMESYRPPSRNQLSMINQRDIVQPSPPPPQIVQPSPPPPQPMYPAPASALSLGPLAQSTPPVHPYRPDPVQVVRPGPTLPSQPVRQPNPYASLAPRPAAMAATRFNQQPNMVVSFQPPYNNGANDPPNDQSQQDHENDDIGNDEFDQGVEDNYNHLGVDRGGEDDVAEFANGMDNNHDSHGYLGHDD